MLRLIPSTILIALLAAHSPAALASGTAKAAGPHAAISRAAGWSGVWERVNNDPTIPADDPRAAERKLSAEAAVVVPDTYNDEWRAKYQQSLKEREEHPLNLCQFGNLGYLASMTWRAISFQAVVAEDEVSLFLYPSGVRHIDFGRAHPPLDELFPNIMGDSIGRWDGDTLVVDTIGGAAYVYASRTFAIAPLSDKAHTIERLRLIDPDTLESRITVEDPVALTRPWNFTMHYHRVRTMRHIIEYGC